MGCAKTYDPKIVAEGHRILALPYQPLPVWNKFLKFLHQHKITYIASKVHVDMVLCDPQNRDEAMVVGYDAHGNLSRIKAIGGDLKKLTDAICIEMPPPGTPEHEDIIMKNKFMIDTSNELLAPLTGRERYRSIGCSHTSQAVKAGIAGCPTAFEDIGVDGFMNVDKISSNGTDEDITTMCTVGWDWTVIPYPAAITWPESILIGTRALNASNSVPTLPSETSAMMGIQALIRQGDTETDAIAKILKQQPPCADYITQIKDMAVFFNDTNFNNKDEDALVKLNRYASQHGGNIKLGKDFLSNVIHDKFPSRSSMALTRLAACYTNLVSPPSRVEHGVGVLLRPATLRKSWQASDQSLNLEIEEFFVDVTGLVATMCRKGVISAAQEVGLQGRCFIRATLLVNDMEGKGHENTKYSTIANIKKQFKAELEAASHKKNIKVPWEIRLVASDAAAAKAIDGDDASSDDIDNELDTPAAAVAKEMGCKVGEFCFERAIGCNRVYKIQSIGADVAIVQLPVGKIVHAPVTVVLNKFISNFKALPLKLVPQEISGAVESLMAPDAFPFKVWEAQCTVIQALLDAESKFGHADDDFSFITTMKIIAAKRFDVGKLRLAPVTTHLDLQQKASVAKSLFECRVATDGTLSFLLKQLPKFLKDVAIAETVSADGKRTKTENVLVPFWWVKPACGEEAVTANMVLKPYKDGKVSFEILTNDRVVEQGDQLITHFMVDRSMFSGPKAAAPAAKATAPAAKAPSSAMKAMKATKAPSVSAPQPKRAKK